MARVTRRRFLGGVAGVAATAAIGGPNALGRVTDSFTPAALPPPAQSGIEHIVVVMMENRSFDHMLGWLPGADGKQAGLNYRDKNGVAHPTHRLKDFQGCAHPDPDHSYDGGRTQLNNGKCDGFLRSGDNDEFAIGYYLAADLDFYRQAAPRWTVLDRYFAATMAETYPNRFYQHAAQTDRKKNSYDPASMPTIWDRLSAAGVSGRYYFGDLPFLALWGQKYVSISRHFELFLTDCANGTLPAVSFVDPRFLDEGTGTSNDDHPFADIRAGQTFLNQVYSAVVRSPNWRNTVLIFNYDEWGGFFDHVPPARARDIHENPAAGTDFALRGFRTPAMLISPWAKRGFISHRVFDHTSILKMIEWRWGLKPLTIRDATAHNIAEALDFTNKRLTAPLFTVPNHTSAPCQPGLAGQLEQWVELGRMAAANGWRLGPKVEAAIGVSADATPAPQD